MHTAKERERKTEDKDTKQDREKTLQITLFKCSENAELALISKLKMKIKIKMKATDVISIVEKSASNCLCVDFIFRLSGIRITIKLFV